MTRREFVGTSIAVPAMAGWLGSGVSPLVRGTKAQQRGSSVVVVGAGAFGGWSALALLRAGFSVSLIDAWGPGNARASSGGETRVIRGVYNGQDVYIQMAARALTLWSEAERRWGRQVYFRTGALWLCESDDGYVRRSMAPMRASGLRVEEMTPAEAARRYPQVSFAGARTVFFEPEAGFLTARTACELVRESFVREKGVYRQARVRLEAASAGTRLSRVVLSDGSSIEADQFVFACGPWMGEVFPDVIGRRIVATRQEVFFFGTPAADTRYDSDALPVWVHIGTRLTYGLPNHERRGLKIADDTAGDEVNPTTLDRVPTEAGTRRAREILKERFPSLSDAPLMESRVCQYEASGDGDFVVDRHPELENVWLVGGGSGHGFKMGPALGEHVAALIQGQSATKPQFAYDRLKPRPRSL